MNRRKGWFVFGIGAVATVALAASGAGCQSGGTGGAGGSGDSSQSQGSGAAAGTGNPAATTSGTTMTTAATMSTTAGTGAGSPAATTGTGAGGGGVCMADMDAPNVAAINMGTIATGVHVHLTGLVATSHKFLASSSKSGSCLYGVYLSDQGTTAQPYTGILALSYGTDAVTSGDAGKAYCNVVPVMPGGDKIPHDIAPGDVVDVIGKADSFAPSGCTAEPQIQLSGVCQMTRTATGTGMVPPAADLSGQEAALAAPGAVAMGSFHSQWGGSLVKVTNEKAVPQMAPRCGEVDGDGGMVPCITDQYGVITLTNSGLTVNDNVFYSGYLADHGSMQDAVCHAGPEYADTSESFTSIVGFSMLNYCTWSIAPEDKCGGLTPASDDCTAANITTCN